MPFLENVTRGRGIPRERLESVAEHYLRFGGRSPINDQNRALLAALRAELDARRLPLPVYWGNRNWHPYLVDTLRQARGDGVRRLCVIVTSAYSRYSGCRQYREDLAAALLGLAAEPGGGSDVPEVDKIRHYFNHPGFVAAVTDAVVDGLAALPPAARAGARLVFVTHSVPTAMNEAAGPGGGLYARQHRDVAATVTAAVAERLRAAGAGTPPAWDLVYCSRSGPPTQPWLEPDVNDHLRDLHAPGRARRRGGPDRLRLRPHGGRLRPRHRGPRDGRGARAALRPGGHGRDGSPVRRRARRPRARAGGAGPRRRVPSSRRPARWGRRGRSARRVAAGTCAATARRPAARTGPASRVCSPRRRCPRRDRRLRRSGGPARPGRGGGPAGGRAGAGGRGRDRRRDGDEVEPDRRRHGHRPRRRGPGAIAARRAPPTGRRARRGGGLGAGGVGPDLGGRSDRRDRQLPVRHPRVRGQRGRGHREAGRRRRLGARRRVRVRRDGRPDVHRGPGPGRLGRRRPARPGRTPRSGPGAGADRHRVRLPGRAAARPGPRAPRAPARGCGTCAGSGARRSTCAAWRRGGTTATTSGGCTRGTSRPPCSSRPRAA